VPNTRVRLGSALTGAVVTGVLWQATGWVFASFIATSSNYTAIYSSFAILILFMIWLYLSWLILLVGASIAFYHQHPEHMGPEHGRLQLSGRLREQLALTIMQRVGAAFYAGRPAWTTPALAASLRLAMDLIAPVLQALENAGLLRRTVDEPACFLPARPLDTTPVKAVLDAVRSDGEGQTLCPERIGSSGEAARLMAAIDGAAEAALAEITLKDLALAESRRESEARVA